MLVHRPELCLAEGRGTIFLVTLTAIQTEWLAQLEAAHVETAIRHGGPRPFIALVKMDKRFPLQIGFDFNLGELRGALARTRPYFAACALVVTFGGVLGFTMHQAVVDPDTDVIDPEAPIPDPLADDVE